MPIHGYGDDFLCLRSKELCAFFAFAVQQELFEYEPHGSKALIPHLLPFGTSEDGHVLAWHDQESTELNEAAIYVVGSKYLSVTRAADSLYDFVSQCFDHRVKTILGSGYSPLPPTFRPLHRQPPATTATL